MRGGGACREVGTFSGGGGRLLGRGEGRGPGEGGKGASATRRRRHRRAGDIARESTGNRRRVERAATDRPDSDGQYSTTPLARASPGRAPSTPWCGNRRRPEVLCRSTALSAARRLQIFKLPQQGQGAGEALSRCLSQCVLLPPLRPFLIPCRHRECGRPADVSAIHTFIYSGRLAHIRVKQVRTRRGRCDCSL